MYCVLLSIGLAHHELWGDELHSWNIARGNAGYGALLRNIRFEGHPPLWYTILWTLSRFTANPLWMQPVQGLIIALALYLFLFRSPFPFWVKVLLPFGYYFLFEYAVFSRNYAIAVLLVFCLCLVLRRPGRAGLYYLLLFLLSSCHLVALVLAGALHLYYLLRQWGDRQQRKILWLHVLAGGLVFLPSVYFIFPPSDSEMNISFFMQYWSVQQLKNILSAPLKAFMPIPSWSQYHFWNTHFMLEKGQEGLLSSLLTGLVSIALVACAFLSLRNAPKSRLLFAANLIVTFLVALIFPLNSFRYVGFIFIAYIVACWLALQEQYKKPATVHPMFFLLLCLQWPGSAIALYKDFRHPFSHACKTKKLEAAVPAGAKLLTDSWTLNAVAAFGGHAFYCVDYRQEISFILWDRNKSKPLDPAHPYSSGLRDYFTQHADSCIFLVSANSPAALAETDSELQKEFAPGLVAQEEGAIEPYSNLYLYKIINPAHGRQ